MLSVLHASARRIYLNAVSLIALSLLFHPNLSIARDFQELRSRYFIDRSVDYARKLLLREEILGVLYRCTAAEIGERKAEGLDPSLLNSRFADIEANRLDRNAPGIAEADIAERYRLWVDFEYGEYQRRSQKILTLRAALIEDAAPEQKQRMFLRELNQALKYYADGDWNPARFLFDHLLDDYNYREIDDILFYQGQVAIQQDQFDAALGYLLKLIEKYPESKYRPKSYDQASEILSELHEDKRLIELYRAYLKEGSPGLPAEMGGLHVRAARAKVNFGHYSSAVTMLERVDTKSSYYLAARYLLAECLTLLEEWSRAVEVLTDMIDVKSSVLPNDRWRLLVDEARVKLAYIYYHWGDYREASRLFEQVESNSPFNDRALLGQAWIAFQLDEYEETVEKSEKLLRFYPFSSEIYETGSLLGYCYERMGNETNAMIHFFSVLEAGVAQSKLQTFIQERQRLTEVLNQLKALEETVFSSDDEELFETYKWVRNVLEINRKKVGLAELLEVNARMRDLVEERVLLDKLIRDAGVVKENIMLTGAAGLVDGFQALEDRIRSTLDKLEAMRVEQIKFTPLYYREAYIGHVNAVADTLSSRIESEIDVLISSIAETERLYRQALENGQPGECLKYGLRIGQYNEALNQSYEYRTISELTKRPTLKTRVDRWSDFSFHRFAMGGLEFGELDRKYERLKQVEDYILTLMEMLEVREMGRESPIASTPFEEDMLNLRQNGTE